MSNVFSAGLDIHEMYNTNEERLRIIWTELQKAWNQFAHGSSHQCELDCRVIILYVLKILYQLRVTPPLEDASWPPPASIG